MFITIFTLDLAEISNDWLLLKDIVFLEQGLVYGPLSPTIVMILVVASGIGSLTMAFEMFNISREVCTGRPWADLDLVSALVVWLEEVPTMTVNFAISMCHNEPISTFQMSKVLIVALSVTIRIIIPLMRTYIINKDEVETDTRFRKSVYKVVTNAGLCLALSSCIAVIIFTHVIATDERKFQFRSPQDIWSSEYAHDMYFTDVGIYFHHNEMNEPTENQYWLKLANINDFENMDRMYVKISYGKANNRISKLILNSYTETQALYEECYSYHRDTNLYTYMNCTTNFISNSERLTFKLVYSRPQKNLILGDILYNVRYQKNNICYNLSVNNTRIYHNTTGQEVRLLGQLVYLKPVTKITEIHRLVDTTFPVTMVTEAYNIDHTMLEGAEIWKTGMYGCDCSGKAGPSIDSNITLSC